MERILQIKGEQWASGLSIQSTLMKGGIFKQASNFDPFESIGVMQPSLGPSANISSTITKNIKYMTGFNDGGLQSFFAYADDGSTPALYKVSFAGIVSDYTSNITATTSSARGAILWKSKYIYARNDEIRCINPTSTPSDTQLVTISNSTTTDHPLTLGADLNLYFPNGNQIGRLISTAGTSGNTENAFALETGMTIRKLINDGRYLIIMADDGPVNIGNPGNYRCVVAYWDMASALLTQRYDFRETGLIGGDILESAIYVFGQDNIYVTNISTRPQIIFSFKGNSTITGRPTSAGAIIVRSNSILWGSGSNIYGYGSLLGGQPKIFYQPYSISSGNITSMIYNGLTLWVATDVHTLYQMNTTRSESFLLLSNITFNKLYRFEYAKIVTQVPLSSGQSIIVQLATGGGGILLNNATKSFSADGARQALIYKANTSGNPATTLSFQELTTLNIDSFQVPILLFEIWATPLENQNQTI